MGSASSVSAPQTEKDAAPPSRRTSTTASDERPLRPTASTCAVSQHDRLHVVAIDDGLVSRPSMVFDGTTLVIAVRDTAQCISLLKYDYGTNKWSAWSRVHCVATAGPSVASCANGHLDLLVRGRDGLLMHANCEGAWSTFTRLPGTLASSASACSTAEDSLEVFAANAYGELLRRKGLASRWTDWFVVDGVVVASAPTAIATSRGCEVFVKSTDGTVLWGIFDGERWAPWIDVGGVAKSVPCAALNPTGQVVYLFVRGPGDGCFFSTRDVGSNEWSPWKNHGGVHLSAIACCSVPNAMYLVSADAERCPQVSRLTDGEFGPWKRVPNCTMY